MNDFTLGWTWDVLQDPVTKIATTAAKQGASKAQTLIAKEAKKAWEKFEWKSAEQKYRIKLLDFVKSTKILGNPASIEIDKIYTDVYVFDKISAIRRYSESLDEDETDVQAKLEIRPRLNAVEVIKSQSNTYILGRPGAGKTTFLKHLAMTACRGLVESTPIFISLKEWNDSGLSLQKFISKQFDICGFPAADVFLETMLAAGKGLILLDGLDEVNQSQDKRNLVIQDIVNFSNKYDKNKYCLTCRTAATDYSFERYKYVELADFTGEQQEQFASHWYGRSSETLQVFLKAWRDDRSAGFRDLGRTPLLLTLLCLAFDESHTFPKRQVDVYQEAINALLKKWDTSRLIARDKFYKELSYGQRQQLLETVSAEFYFNSKTVFKRDEVAAIAKKFVMSLPDIDDHHNIDGGEIVRQVEAQHGLIVERAIGIYTFSHLTIQEYFTACYIAKNQNANTQRQIIKSALNDQKWREVIIYTVALLPQADSLLDEMLKQLLAMKVASSGILIFLGSCYCSARIAEGAGEPVKGSSRYIYVELKATIEKYVLKLRQPPLTGAELAKFTEHISTLHDFLKIRAGKADYQLSNRIAEAASTFLKSEFHDATKLLGGYFIRPDQFINFFYAARLFIECLEVAITANRTKYITSILTLSERDIEKIEETVHK
jgi:predicted NACHT family NTPase